MEKQTCICDAYRCHPNSLLLDSKKQFNRQWALIDWQSGPWIDNCPFNNQRHKLADRLRYLFQWFFKQ